MIFQFTWGWSFSIWKVLRIRLAFMQSIFLLISDTQGILWLCELIILFIPIVLNLLFFELLLLGVISTLEAYRSFFPKFRAELCLKQCISWRKRSGWRHEFLRHINEIWLNLFISCVSITELSCGYISTFFIVILIVIRRLNINIMLHAFL
jgi:hypothetical protein